MVSNLNKFIGQLQAYQSTQNVFNPWRDYDETCDICPEAPNIRLKQMEHFCDLDYLMQGTCLWLRLSVIWEVNLPVSR